VDRENQGTIRGLSRRPLLRKADRNAPVRATATVDAIPFTKERECGEWQSKAIDESTNFVACRTLFFQLNLADKEQMQTVVHNLLIGKQEYD
jgi:hypothetical protein